MREVVFASAFGTSDIATGFRVAQTASVVPANLVSGDLLSAAFAPAYARESRRDPASGRAMLWGYSIWLTFTLTFVAVGVYCYRDVIVNVIVPGSSIATTIIAQEILGVLCWSIPLFGLSAVQAYALGVHNIYLMTSIRPLIQSLGLLGGTLTAISTGWIQWLSLGFIAAWIAYVAMCSTALIRNGYLGLPQRASITQGWRFIVTGVRNIAPLLLLPVALQTSIVLERVFSSFGPSGLVAAVDYARTISESVMSLIAVPLGVLGLTQLSGIQGPDYRRRVAKMCDFVVVVMMPVSAVLVVGSGAIVSLIYARGNFDSAATNLVSGVLVGLSIGLMFQVLGYSLSRALTAAGRNRSVLLYTLIAIAGQIAVQGVGVQHFGPMAIGLGPSVFGLLLSVGCAFALGELKRVARRIATLLPGCIATLIVVLPDLGPYAAIALVALVWAINIALFPSLRSTLWDQVRPILSKRISRQTPAA
nr:lipid II flippase MurJ [Arthrobacter sp. zg-Y769]